MKKLQITRSVWFCVLFSGLLACNPEKITTQTDGDGVVRQLPFVWKSSISNGLRGYGMYRGYVIEGKGVLCVSMKESPDQNRTQGNQYLQLKSLSTGETLWSWDDLFNKRIGSLRQSVKLYDGKMLIHDGTSDYLIDSKLGKTIWKTKNDLPSSGPHPAFLNDKFFVTSNTHASSNNGRMEEGIFEGDATTGNLRELVKPNYSEEYAIHRPNSEYYIGSLINIEAFTRNNNDYLVVPHVEMGPNVKYNDNRAYFGVYNLSQNKWVYERVPLNYPDEGTSACLKPIVDGNSVYLTSLNSVACFEVLTGEKVWQHKLTEKYTGFGDFIKVGNRLILNGHDAMLYCLDTNTGSKLWTQPSSAIASDLYHQDGIIYWISTNELRAVDLETGKLCWNMKSLDTKEENRPDSWYWGFVTGIPSKDGKKGRIFATTNLNLYCFEAIR
jgi:outer membrane protein assembly factor BamB